MIKIREKMRLTDGRWAALGAYGTDNAIVLVEDDGKTEYFFSSNSGKTFAKHVRAEGEEKATLTVAWPGGAKKRFASIAEVNFFGQSPAQRSCRELRRHLGTLGIAE